jgi:hypothetical protein
MASNGNRPWSLRMMVLPVAPFRSREIPAIAFQLFDHVANHSLPLPRDHFDGAKK